MGQAWPGFESLVQAQSFTTTGPTLYYRHVPHLIWLDRAGLHWSYDPPAKWWPIYLFLQIKSKYVEEKENAEI